MEQTQPSENNLIKHFLKSDHPLRSLAVIVILAIALGIISGYLLSQKNKGSTVSTLSVGTPKSAQQDTKTFKDFAQGTLKVKPQPSGPGEYTEGTHVLEREGAVPVALTSSVVDLSKYEGKKVKVFGETQKALKEGWLMDVGKVEETK